MKSVKIASTKVIVSIFVIYATLSAGQQNTEKHLWKPAADEVYLQEVGQKITTDNPVTAIAVFDDVCYAVIDNTIFKLENDNLAAVKSAPIQVNKLMALEGSLWALSDKGLFRFFNKKWQKLDDQKFVDLCLHQGALHAATRDAIYRLEEDKLVNIEPEGGYYTSNTTMMMEDGTQILADPVRIGPVSGITSYTGTLYILGPGELALFDGKIVNHDFIDWGTLPSQETRDFFSFGSRLFITTDRGLAVLRGAALTLLKGENGLPYENTTCLAKGFDGDLWIGTTTGAIRMLKDDWHYFGPDHWLPGNNVHDIAVDDKTVYIATDAGIGIVRYEPFTLLKKAAYYERHIDEWGHKRLGFIHTLYKRGDEWVREVSDNDGGHTAPYLAAMCHKYVVTGDETARQEAVEAFKAMLWLDRVTPKDGFIARAIWSATGDADTRGRHGSGGLPAKWYPTEDGKWYWKGDTSSDEVIAHFYSVSIFHDLVAQGKEKELAAEHLARIASHIIDNGWVMRDMDDKPTRWGRWDPQYLLRPYGEVDRGLNGLEAQTFMMTAIALTGEQKYKDGLQQLLDWGYQNHTVRQKNTFPPEAIAPWDDNLAYRSYYTIMRYVDDAQLRSIYLRSLARTWEVKRMEHIAWFNFAYGALTGNDCEVDQSVKHLREWPLDCVEHTFTNSHRSDLHTEPGYVAYQGGTRGMSPRETAVMRGSRNALDYDGGAGSRRVMEPTGFLRDYWMARYHGFIEAPKTDEPDLISVKQNRGKQLGAKPYEGEPRPELY
ncbi:hypothetical protein KC799_02850 [candidate division KSB1 bacterium]|nr:hypothetical protein [candidate division KSB1 bacterium]